VRVCLFLNHACNLRCRYCYNGRKFHRAMPWEVAQAGIQLMLRDGGPEAPPAQLSFFGGEPLLEMPLLRRAVAYTEHHAGEIGQRVRFLVVTNGTLLRGQVLDYLLEHQVYLGVSIDGTREAHDATRRFRNGRSSYDRVRDNLRAVIGRDGGPGLRVIAVVNPDNVDQLPDSFDALLALGARNLSINLDYEGAWDEPARERFAVALESLGDRYVAAYRRGEHFTLNLLDSKVVTHLKGGYACADRCDFGCEEVAVAPSGRLYPCDRLVGMDDRDEVVIGQVFSGIDPVRRDALIASKNQVLQDCGDCALLPRCMHWCGCVNHAMTGAVGEVDGLLCWFEQQLIEQADRCASLLYAEENAGFVQRFYMPRVRVEQRRED
jgi:uncharacterized protein